MADSKAGKRYAQALFNTALKYDVVKSVEEDLAGITSLLANDEQFRDFLISPYVGREEKLGIAERLFSDRVTALTMQVLRIMLEKRREEDIPSVREEFVRLRREHEGVVFAVVTSAEALEADQRQALETKLSSSSGRRVEAEYRIDPHLIGGVRVAFGNHVMDGTLKGTLRRLRERLTYDLLKQA
jgi:F-type H+-transporting ATPase subunit delta